MLVSLDHLCVKAVLEQVSDAVVERVEPLRVDAVDPVKRARDCLHRAFHHHVRVVRHETVRMRREPSLLEQPPQQRCEEPVVVCTAEDQAAVDAADGDMEDPVRRKHPSGDTGHEL